MHTAGRTWECGPVANTDKRLTFIIQACNGLSGFYWAPPQYQNERVLPGMGIKIRRSWDCLNFIMGIPILVRQYLYIETTPWLLAVIQYEKLTSWAHKEIVLMTLSYVWLMIMPEAGIIKKGHENFNYFWVWHFYWKMTNPSQVNNASWDVCVTKLHKKEI